jgi:hypothetical protein
LRKLHDTGALNLLGAIDGATIAPVRLRGERAAREKGFEELGWSVGAAGGDQWLQGIAVGLGAEMSEEQVVAGGQV